MDIPTIWVAEDNKGSVPCVAGKAPLAPFPVFQYVATERKQEREARWRAEYPQLIEAQRAYIRNYLLYSFGEACKASEYLDLKVKRALAHRVSDLATQLSTVPGIRTEYHLYLGLTFLELTFVFSLGSVVHKTHLCNLSPSEYART